MSSKQLHSKLSKKKILSHLPPKNQGHDGDLQIISIRNKGTFLCLKNNGDWKISDKFNNRNKFNTHEFDKIKTQKMYGKGGLGLSLVGESVTTNTYTLKAPSPDTNIQPIVKVGDGSNPGVLSSLGNQELLLKTGNSTTSHISIFDGANGSVVTAMNGTGKFDIVWESDDSDSGELGLLNIGEGSSFLNLQVAHGQADPFVRYAFLADDPANNKQWITGMDGSATNEPFVVNYLASNTLLTPSNGATKLTIDTSGNVTAGNSFVVGNTTITTSQYDVSSGDFTLDVAGDIILKPTGDDVMLKNSSDDTIYSFDLGTPRFQMSRPDNTSDYFRITVAAEGATTLKTDDDDTAVANLILDADGIIKLDSANIALGEGVQFLMNGTKVGDVTGHHSGTYFTLYENIGASTVDFFNIICEANGATTLTTTDTNAEAGHLTLAPDGDLILNPKEGKFIAQNNGTEFSVADSAYAGMIIGYTRLEGDLINQNSYEIQNAMTVEDDTHQITFITPPSEYVEIELTCHIDVGSTDTQLGVGLSSASATSGYSALSTELEYDVCMFNDDEIDDDALVVKFVCKASHLASIGSSNTFYIGFSTNGSTKTAYLKYGLRVSHGIANQSMVIKATALPATIYDGT